MTQAAPLLSVRGMIKRYGEATVLDGVDFDLSPGEILGIIGPNGAGKAGYADGPAATARFDNPTGVAPLPNGAVVVADRNNNRLRLVTPDGAVTTLAGTGEAGFADGEVASARFNQPLDVEFDDSMSRVLVSEDKGHRLRVLPKDTRR